MQHTKEIKVPNESSLTARDFQNNPGKVDAAFVRAAVLSELSQCSLLEARPH